MDETTKFHLLKGWPEATDPGADALDLNTLIIDDQLPLAFGFDQKTSAGLVEGHTGGYVYDSSGLPVRKSKGTYTLTKNATNYVGRNIQGDIVVSLTGFAKGIIPLRISKTDETGVYDRKDVRMPNLGRETATTVTSFNGRDGDVVPMAGDYSAVQIGVDPIQNLSPASTNVQAAIDELSSKIQNHQGAVSSVFGRTGDIQAAKGDYTASLVTISNIPLLGSVDTVQAAIDGIANKLKDEAVFSFKGRHGEVMPEAGDYSASLIACTPPTGFVSHNLQALLEEYKAVLSSVSVGVSSFNGRQGNVMPQYGDYNASQIRMTQELVAGRDNVQNTLEAILEYLRNSGIPVITSSAQQYYSLPSGSLNIALPLAAVGGTGALTFSVDTGTTADLNATVNNTTKILSTNCATYGAKVLNIKVTDSSTPTTKSATKSLAFTVTNLAITNSDSNNVSVMSDSLDMNFTLTASGGTGPYRFEIVSSNIPGASILNSILHSVNIANGTYTATIKCIDANNVFVSKTLTFNTTIVGTIKIVAPDAVSIIDSTTLTGSLFYVTQISVGGIPQGKTPTYSVVQTSGPTLASGSSYLGIVNSGGSLWLVIAESVGENRNLNTLGAQYEFELRATLDGYTEKKKIKVTDSRTVLTLKTQVTANSIGRQYYTEGSTKQIAISATISRSGGKNVASWSVVDTINYTNYYNELVYGISVSGNQATVTSGSNNTTFSAKVTLPTKANMGAFRGMVEGKVRVVDVDGVASEHVVTWYRPGENLIIPDATLELFVNSSSSWSPFNAQLKLGAVFSGTSRKCIPAINESYIRTFNEFARLYNQVGDCAYDSQNYRFTYAAPAAGGIDYLNAVPKADKPNLCQVSKAVQLHNSITDLQMHHDGTKGSTGSGKEYPTSVTISKAKYYSRYSGGTDVNIHLGLAIKTDASPNTWLFGPTEDYNGYVIPGDLGGLDSAAIEVVSVSTISAPVGGSSIWVSGSTYPYVNNELGQTIRVNTKDANQVPVGRYVVEVKVRPMGDLNLNRAFTKQFTIDVVA